MEDKDSNIPKGVLGNASPARVHLCKLTSPCRSEMGDSWNVGGNSTGEANGLACVAGCGNPAISIQPDYQQEKNSSYTVKRVAPKCCIEALERSGGNSRSLEKPHYKSARFGAEWCVAF